MRKELLLVIGLGMMVGCSGSTMPPAGPIEEAAKDWGDDKSHSFTTGTFKVGTGDIFECFYTSLVTDKMWSVQNSFGQQGAGGHHVTVYYSTVPPKPVGHHPCNDAEMAEWRQIAGTAGDDGNGEGSVGLPDGLAIKVPPGKQIVMQAHYINATAETLTVNDQVTLVFADPNRLKAYANYVVVNDDGFQVQPQSTLRRTSVCKMPQDFQVVLMLGHLHEFGKTYTLERMGGNGAPEMLYQKVWNPSYTSHPPLTRFSVDAPLKFAKGEQLRQTCEWDNNSSETLRFPREMCVGFMYYFPDNGEQFCEITSVQ